jgi:uncharacterized sulfatase
MKPHILVIVLDTTRRDHLSTYRYPYETSPALDAFAAESSVFERAVAPAQWTIPAHGSLFTGLYPNTHGLHQAYQQLSGSYPTLAELLQVADYHTVAFCNNPLLGILENGLQRGFDHFYNYAGATPDRPQDMRRSRLRRTMAANMRHVARRVTNQFAHSDTLFRASLHPWLVPIWSRLVNFKGNTARSIDDLIAYWQQHTAGGTAQPLFAFMNLMGTHLPYRPPRAYLPREVAQDRQAYRFMAEFNADGARWISPTETAPLTDWQTHTLDAFYDAEIRYQDEQLARLFHFLKRSGALDDTLVIVLADHGEGHGDHGYMGHSFVVYQELVHVPLIVHYPAHFPAGKRIQTTVSTRRIFHTILEAAGIPSPLATPLRETENLSLARAINGRPDPEGNIAYAEAFPPVNLLNILQDRAPQTVERLQLTLIRRGVYVGDHKLTLVGQQIEGLYHIPQDPTETDNLAPQHPALAQQLKTQVETFVTATQQQRADAEQQGEVSAEVLDNLRALGYLD